ncbi:phage tail tape measure protein [Siminovitchia terrae]|uniref:Phage tail tape measure protein n=1 Tax=Siminovitchia terrae TaxID=1914933 RepID=A0A429X8D8_SIMTE|nr:phage tail tape measure protein [Siminovitchia terrae]RST59715.1 phage tail tape measure protein [Siminovitchia terrae]
MAIGGTPVGNMIIKVDLDSAGVEKSMTGLQRQLKSSNKAMGAQLSAFGRGEKSAAKYGVLIEGLTNRHRIQARMVEEAREKYRAMSNQYGENSVKAQKASQVLNEQIARYQETGRELDNVSAEFKEFQRVQDIQNKGWYRAADSMEQWGGKLKGAGAAMDHTGQQLTRKVTLPLGIVGGLAVKTGMDFESGMSKVAAISGATGKDFKALEKQARHLGATTIFSAKEASEGMQYLALAGWKTKDIMAGMPGMLNLAAAGALDLGRAADITSDTMAAFGMDAKKAGHAADVFAYAQANANTNVEQLGEGMKYIAPVANNLGWTLEGTSAAMMALANQGLKGSIAGQAFASSLSRLASPGMQKKIKGFGLSFFDANENMKPLPDIIAEIEKKTEGMTAKQKQAMITTLFGAEATKHWSILLSTGSKELGIMTENLENADGTAADMAATMQDNLAGSLKELRSKLEDLFITTYKNLNPALNRLVDSAKDATDWFAQLSPKTQENIIKFGLLAAAAGPAISGFGKLTFGAGALLEVSGKLTKTIGMAGKSGAVGAIAGLSKAGVVGLAIAGVAALSVGVYKLVQKSNDAKEVNLDLTKSLSDQAVGLQKSVDTFDKLSDKAKISNEELARLNDLNIRISQSSNPGEIEQLQRQYDELAKKSGLSKSELEQLFAANQNIIKQSPDVKKSVSDQGNAFVESTAAVKQYIEKLYEMSRTQIEAERVKQLEREKELRKEIASQQSEYKSAENDLNLLLDAQNMSKKELKAKQTEINKELQNNILTMGEKKELEQQLTTLQDAQKGNLKEEIQKRQDILAQKDKSVKKSEEELEKIKALDPAIANIRLKQVGINEEGEKGLAQLDKVIAKNQEEMAQLEAKHQKNGDLTAEEHRRYTKLSETTQKQIEARDYIHDELNLYKDLNSLAQAKKDKLSKEKQQKIESLAKTTEIKVEEGNIVKQIQKKNDELLKERNSLEESRKKQGANTKEIDKQIAAIDKKRLKNDEVLEKILKELGIWDQVKGSIQKASGEVGKKNQKQKETNKELDKENQKHDQGKKKQQEKNKAIDQGTGKQKSQGQQIDNNNKKTDKGIQKEQQRTKEAGKSVDKKVTAKDHGTVAKIDQKAKAPKDKRVTAKDHGSVAKIDQRAKAAKTKKVNVTAGSSITTLNRQASSPVTKVVNFVGKGLGKLKFWAKGTPPQGHPGGAAVVGDGGGRELIKLPDGRSFLSPSTDTLLNLPRGTHVIPHRETARLLKSVKHYAAGTKNWKSMFEFENVRNNEFMKLLALTGRNSEAKVQFATNTANVQKGNDNQHLEKIVEKLSEQVKDTKEIVSLLAQLLMKDPNIYIDGRMASVPLEKHITEIQNRNKEMREKFV